MIITIRRTLIILALLVLALAVTGCDHYSPWKDEYGKIHDQFYCYQTNYSNVTAHPKHGVSFTNSSSHECIYP